jgi:hypothetical protein
MRRSGRTCLLRSFVGTQGHEIVFDKNTGLASLYPIICTEQRSFSPYWLFHFSLISDNEIVLRSHLIILLTIAHRWRMIYESNILNVSHVTVFPS